MLSEITVLLYTVHLHVNLKKLKKIKLYRKEEGRVEQSIYFE